MSMRCTKEETFYHLQIDITKCSQPGGNKENIATFFLLLLPRILYNRSPFICLFYFDNVTLTLQNDTLTI